MESCFFYGKGGLWNNSNHLFVTRQIHQIQFHLHVASDIRPILWMLPFVKCPCIHRIIAIILVSLLPPFFLAICYSRALAWNLDFILWQSNFSRGCLITLREVPNAFGGILRCDEWVSLIVISIGEVNVTVTLPSASSLLHRLLLSVSSRQRPSKTTCIRTWSLQ